MDVFGVLAGAALVALLLLAMWRVVVVLFLTGMVAIWLVGALQVMEWVHTWT